MKFGACVFFALLGNALGDMSEVHDHCDKACFSYLHPDDVEDRKALQRVIMGECGRAYRRSNYDGKICRQAFLDTGALSCKIGCVEMIQGNVVANRVELGAMRQTCEQHRGGHNGMFAKESCDRGVEAGTYVISAEGVRLRSEIDKICTHMSDDTQQPTKVVVEEKIPEPVKQVVKEEPTKPVEEPEPVLEETEEETIEEAEEEQVEEKEPLVRESFRGLSSEPKLRKSKEQKTFEF